MLQNLWEIIFLSLIEGITEYLPISSTGHLLIAQEVMSLTDEFKLLFPVVCQLGAIFAVLFMYWERFESMLPWHKDFFSRSKFKGLHAYFSLLIATFPALICGLLLDDIFELYLKHPLCIAAALAFGGIAIIVIESAMKSRTIDVRLNYEHGSEVDSLSLTSWFKLGFIQCLAIIPGVSRSGATIIGGLMMGLNRRQVTLASFFMAVPVLFAASGYKLLKHYHLLSTALIAELMLGIILSFLVSYCAIKWLLDFIIKRDSFAIFGWYRILIGIVIVIMQFL